eukprot:361102-Chlamydomonas_euryale.AAC.3
MGLRQLSNARVWGTPAVQAHARALSHCTCALPLPQSTSHTCSGTFWLHAYLSCHHVCGGMAVLHYASGGVHEGLRTNAPPVRADQPPAVAATAPCRFFIPHKDNKNYKGGFGGWVER